MKLKKFILGAANFGNNYGLKPKNLSEKEIQEILSTSSKLGLKIIDQLNLMEHLKILLEKNFQNLN